jgi:hypothetical protein
MTAKNLRFQATLDAGRPLNSKAAAVPSFGCARRRTGGCYARRRPAAADGILLPRIMTIGSNSAMPPKGRRLAEHGVAKPFTFEALGSKLRSVLGDKS